jgi:hypothetical protein
LLDSLEDVGGILHQITLAVLQSMDSDIASNKAGSIKFLPFDLSSLAFQITPAQGGVASVLLHLEACLPWNMALLSKAPMGAVQTTNGLDEKLIPYQISILLMSLCTTFMISYDCDLAPFVVF